MIKVALLGDRPRVIGALEIYKELENENGENVPNIELVGVWTPRSSLSKKLTTKYDLKIYSSPEKVLSDQKVDLVEICGPEPEIADIAINALNEGKHASIHPPPALSSSKMENLIEATEASKNSLRVADVLSQAYPFRKALELAKEKKLGRKIYTCNLSSISTGNPTRSLFGDAYIIAGYMVSLLGDIEQVLGWPSGGSENKLSNDQNFVCAFIPRDEEKHGTWMHSCLPSLKMGSKFLETDFLANFVSSHALAFAFGATGSMFEESPVSTDPGIYWIHWKDHKWKSDRMEGAGYKDSLLSETLDFVKAAIGGEKEEPSPQRMRKQLLIANAIAASIKKHGNPVKVEEAPTSFQIYP